MNTNKRSVTEPSMLWFWILAMVEAVRGCPSATNSNPALMKIPWDRHIPGTSSSTIAATRAQNGADGSNLGFAMDMLSANRTNLEAANSRIIDVDVAQESTHMARNNILVQASAAMRSQANQSSQIAMKLLQG